ncbi:ribosomal protein L2 [Coniophora puteana RWD-64-598 SS2]|uniref:Large ribosomal subunit protein uL2m n=1 Tax=Coniophora puteana (strain RWD-64-598) TaxID=741705 RepID=A0A5M3N7I7_CONPW|nr:ribosomal protein L2 [Coniophora puteana RWD-64-598 SS2]EIW87276.1 ribosomal protein L2 [Coniophora puteana RWD-64-598 SS2]
MFALRTLARGSPLRAALPSTSARVLPTFTPSLSSALSSNFTSSRSYANVVPVPPQSDFPSREKALYKGSKRDVPKAASLDLNIQKYKTYKPVTPGLRHRRQPINDHLWAGRPVRDLTIAQRKNGGRNNTGRITVRWRGGGHRRRIRLVDFERKDSGVCDVVRIEYDPGRSAHIALVKNRDSKRWSYILASDGLRAGDTVESFRSGIPPDYAPGVTPEELERITAPRVASGHATATASSAEDDARARAAGSDAATAHALMIGILRNKTIRPGNFVPLRLVPVGTTIHNIALRPAGPGVLVRSAGAWAQLMVHEPNGKYVHVRLQSGEVRKVLSVCCAAIGKVSNVNHHERQLGKAGRSRWLGRRPSVRGVAMNACDHPHGGGRGRSKSNKHPVSVWGWPTKGKRTRRPKDKDGNKMVVKERPRGKAKRAGGN